MHQSQNHEPRRLMLSTDKPCNDVSVMMHIHIQHIWTLILNHSLHALCPQIPQLNLTRPASGNQLMCSLSLPYNVHNRVLVFSFNHYHCIERVNPAIEQTNCAIREASNKQVCAIAR
jgi:hypothetical protein